MSLSVSSPQLPFECINLRRNPFGEVTLDEWAKLAVVNVDALVDWLSESGRVVQFVGEKGYGKTTHLLAIRARFPDASYVHIPEGEYRSVPAGHPILVDEAQRLMFWQRWTLFRSDVPLVLGTHYDYDRALRRSGRTVRTVAVDRETTAERLHTLLNDRIEAARRQEGPVPVVSQETAAQLLQTYGPNIRAALHEMYGRIQDLTEIRNL